MRSLGFILFTCSIFFLGLAQAAPGQIHTKLSNISSQGSVVTGILDTQKNSQSNAELSAQTPTLFGTSTLTATFTNSLGDLPAFQLYHYNESQAGFSLDYSKGADAFFINHTQTISDSPVAQKSYSASYYRSFFNGLTSFGFALSKATKIQPYSNYIDPNSAANLVRPLHLNSEKFELIYEQIWGESLKGQYKLFHGQRYEDRPEHFGFETRHSIALTDSQSLRWDLGYLDENRKQKLLDEKGYYTVSWSEAFYNLEINYDWLLSFGIGTTVEREYQPSPYVTNSLTQLGTDSLVIQTKYKGQRWQFGLMARSSASNNSYRSDSVAGDFTWDL